MHLEQRKTHRVLDPICRSLQVHVDTPRPEFTRRGLQLENFGGLWTEHVAALLAGVLVAVSVSGR